MNFFKKLFGKKQEEFQPDNTVLLELLHIYQKNPDTTNYKLVFEELQGNRAILYVPSVNDISLKNTEWETTKADTQVSFTSVFNQDGLLVFGVFTSEEALAKWTQRETTYIAMPAKQVLKLAQQNNFNRIVIDSDQDTMFVLERDVSNTKTIEIDKKTDVLVWTPKQPISGSHKNQLCQAFAKVSSIQEVYHFGMTRNGEQILILSILLDELNDNSQLAVLSAINDGMEGFELNLPLEMLYINEMDGWYKTSKEFELFYRKS